MKKLLSLVFVFVFVCSFTAFAAADESRDGFGAYDHVFIIGVDGGGAAFSKTDTPCFDSIFSDYAFRHDAAAEYLTISAQNWGSILTGLPYDVHGFTNSSIAAAERDSSTGAHTLFYYVRQAHPQAVLSSFVDWSPLNYGLVENDLDVYKQSFPNDDPGVTAALEAYFDAGNAPELLFVQLDNPDHMAHAYGGFSEEYYESIRTADAQIGRIYAAIEAQRLMENGLFIVVADHGETAGGHGGQTPEETNCVVAAAGHNVNKMTLPEGTRNRDVAAIALYALGIEQPDCFVCGDPQVLFGEERWHAGAPSTEPSTEPTEEPTNDHTDEPSGGNNGGTSLLDFWQGIINWFRKLFTAIRDWFVK